MPYTVEYTDTFGGEPNYCWVRRGTIADSAMDGPDCPPYGTKAYRRRLLRLARLEVGLDGARGRIIADYGDAIHWKPNGCCTVLMVMADY